MPNAYQPPARHLTRHYRLVRGIVADERLRAPGQRKVRDLALAMAWAWYCTPPRTGWWDGVRMFGDWPPADIRRAIAVDLPRYEVPRAADRGCVAAMIRRAGLCGRPGRFDLDRWDETTGEGESVFYCSQKPHERLFWEERDRQRELFKSGTLPEPWPNRGGVLPGHFRHPGLPWSKMYAWSVNHDWTPPTLGIVADDWPTAAQAKARRLLLEVVDGGGEVELEPAGQALPALRLVPFDEAEA